MHRCTPRCARTLGFLGLLFLELVFFWKIWRALNRIRFNMDGTHTRTHTRTHEHDRVGDRRYTQGFTRSRLTAFFALFLNSYVRFTTTFIVIVRHPSAHLRHYDASRQTCSLMDGPQYLNDDATGEIGYQKQRKTGNVYACAG